MKAEIEIEVEGERHTLALPIGGLEEIARVNPFLFEVAEALAHPRRPVKFDELTAVLRAGAKWGGKTITADRIVEAVGLSEAAKIALRLMAAAFADDSGNSDAAAKSETQSASSSAPETVS